MEICATLLQEFFCDLNRVQRGTLEELVADDPEAEAIIEGAVFADAADLAVVAFGEATPCPMKLWRIRLRG